MEKNVIASDRRERGNLIEKNIIARNARKVKNLKWKKKSAWSLEAGES
jgi:hypothetical protein